MSKFFNLSSSKEEQNNSERMDTNYNSTNNQNYVPDNSQYQSSNYNETPETFVYNSYPTNQNNEISNLESMRPLENYMPSNQENLNQNYSNMDVLDENEVLEFPTNTQEMNGSVQNQRVKQEAPALDPLNNANNPIPVNPVAEVKETFVEEELPTDVKANIFAVIGMMLGMAFSPGTTIVENSKKYRSTSKALIVTAWITAVTLVLCIGVRILVGSFNKTYSAVTASYRINFDFTNIFQLENYTQPLLIAFIMSFGCIIIVSLIYYASSFLNSKGVQYGSYLMVSNLALQPLIIGVVCLYPIAALISTYVALLVLIFSFLYSLVSFLIGIGEILKFKNVNREILYNVLNISIIILVMIVIFVILINSSVIILPELNL